MGNRQRLVKNSVLAAIVTAAGIMGGVVGYNAAPTAAPESTPGYVVFDSHTGAELYRPSDIKLYLDSDSLVTMCIDGEVIALAQPDRIAWKPAGDFTPPTTRTYLPIILKN